MEYDKENRCCNGESRPKSTTEGCCGDLEFFNKETQGCCINAVYSKETEYCCGGLFIMIIWHTKNYTGDKQFVTIVIWRLNGN